MSNRAGMDNLIVRWRRLVNDTAGSVWTDDEAQDILDTYRVELWHHKLTPLSQHVDGTTIWKAYHVGYGNLEDATGGTAVWRIHDGQGTALGTATYSADYLRGIVTFTADQVGSVRYVDARAYDLNGAAAHGWRELMGLKASLYKFTADGASYERQQWFDHAERMAKYFDTVSTMGAGSIRTAKMVRGDLNVD